MEALTIWRKSKRKYVNEVPSNRIKDEVKACQGMKLLVSRRIFNWGGPGPTHLWPWKETQGKAFQIQIGLFLGGFICILLLDGGIISRSYSHRKARFHIQGQDNKAVVVDVLWRLHSFCQKPNKMLYLLGQHYWKLVNSNPKTTTPLVLHIGTNNNNTPANVRLFGTPSAHVHIAFAVIVDDKYWFWSQARVQLLILMIDSDIARCPCTPLLLLSLLIYNHGYETRAMCLLWSSIMRYK